MGVPDFAGALSPHGFPGDAGSAFREAAFYLAGPDHRAYGSPRVLLLECIKEKAVTICD
jgi:hypothetical protein